MTTIPSHILTDSYYQARRSGIADFNVAFLAEQAKLASNGFFTVTSNENHTHLSLVRTDGKPLGYHDDDPTTGFCFLTFVPTWVKLNRRHRTFLKDVANAIQTVLYSNTYQANFFLARRDIGKVAFNDGTDNGLDSQYGQVLSASARFNVVNRLHNVKDSHNRL